MTKPDVILWDWDNTLINTRAVAEKALRQLGQETGVEVTDDEVTEVIGGHLVDFWYRHYGPDPIAEVDRFINYYRQYSDHVTLFPETVSVLEWGRKKNIPQLVVSNKNQEILDAEVERLGIRDFFQKVVGSHNHGYAKPSPEFADIVFGKNWPKHILMIGDGESDMQFAQTVHAFGLLIRAGEREVDFHYDHRVASLKDVLDFLEKMT